MKGTISMSMHCLKCFASCEACGRCDGLHVLLCQAGDDANDPEAHRLTDVLKTVLLQAPAQHQATMYSSALAAEPFDPSLTTLRLLARQEHLVQNFSLCPPALYHVFAELFVVRMIVFRR